MKHEQRLLVVDAANRSFVDASPDALASLLAPGDLVVVNDAATLPASLRMTDAAGRPHEVRLVEAPERGRARAVLFGPGDHRTKTEDRPAPRRFVVGESLTFGAVHARVLAVSNLSARLVELGFEQDDAEVLGAIVRYGTPVQYSYVPEPIPLHAVQTIVASRPWAVEMPSAARPLRFAMLFELRRRGIAIASITHAAGLSATGDEALDAVLPLPERYEIPAETARRIVETRERGGRVIAVGTSVVRALEDSAARFGAVESGRFVADLVLDESSRRRVVDGLLTGIHVEGESHHRLLRAFVDDETLGDATNHALRTGYRVHEFGDACLVLCARVDDDAHVVAA